MIGDRSESPDDDDDDLGPDDDDEDSDDDFEVNKNLPKPSRCHIPLESSFKLFWDHLQIVLLLYVGIFVPYKITFLGNYEIPAWDYFDYFIDFLFFIDLILNFFTPYFVKEHQVKNLCYISCNYLKLWFWIDLLSVFPFQFLFTNVNMDSYSILLRISKTPRLYKFMKGAKMLRTIKMQKKGQKTFISRTIAFFYENESLIFSILPVYCLGILLAHLFACLWFFIASNSGDPDTWLIIYEYDDEPPFDQYWASLYYIYTTFTTCGYGDIVPHTFDETVCTIIFVGSGVTFLSFVYTNMMEKLDNYNQRYLEFHTKK